MASALGLLAADLLAWLLCAGVVFQARALIWEVSPVFSVSSLAVFGWIIFRFGNGLYPPTGLSQPEAHRLSFYTTAGAALIHLAMLLAVGEHDLPLLSGLMLWVLLLPTAYLFRSLVRAALIRLRLFGEPCVVIGTGEKARRTIRELKANPELGLVPVGAFGDTGQLNQTELEGVPVLGPIEAASSYRFSYPVARALVALSRSEADAVRLTQLMEELAKPYPALQVLADLAISMNLLVLPRAIGPYLSLEFRHFKMALPRPRPSVQAMPPVAVPPEGGKADDDAFSAVPLACSPSSHMATVLGLLAADLLAWLLCAGVVFQARALIWEVSPVFSVSSLAVFGWIIFRFGSGLYPPTGLSQPEAHRLSFYTTAGAALIHLAMLLAVGEHDLPLLSGLMLWVLLLPTAYLFRSLVRAALIRLRLFGEPCVVIGTGEKARRTIRELKANPELGLVPVGAFGDTGQLNQTELEGVPVLGPIEAASSYRFSYPVARALVALSRSEADAVRLTQLMEELAKPYPALQVLADLAISMNLLVLPRAIGPYLSLEFRHRRFSRKQKIFKRVFDLAVAGPVFLAALPLIGIAALLVKIFDPTGPVFFSQTREGAGGKPIRIWKIRTMVVGAERRLADHLAANAAARFEYERTLKLHDDPRILPKVGKYLRRYSIDELPQLWSVIRGDMSLVGPRVMLGHEVERFSEKGRELRRDVPPGLTGFWQVMYRNNSDLQIWEVADSYYVANWSVWLDGWIVLRTVHVVITGAGAY